MSYTESRQSWWILVSLWIPLGLLHCGCSTWIWLIFLGSIYEINIQVIGSCISKLYQTGYDHYTKCEIVFAANVKAWEWASRSVLPLSTGSTCGKKKQSFLWWLIHGSSDWASAHEDPKDKWWPHLRERNDRTAMINMGYGNASLCRNEPSNAGPHRNKLQHHRAK